jgi:peptidoglycan hydrolase CwlO-like protein
MKNGTYIFNPNLSSEELENWLAAQKAALANYNNLKREKTALEREIAALSKQLSEVERKLESANDFFTSDKLSFPWDPNPLPKVDKL